jgi:hypothetical protein
MSWTWITQHPTESITAVLAVTTTLAIAIRAAIPLLTKLADLTSSRADNEFLLRVAPKLDAVIAALDVVRRILPRVVVGPLPSTQPIASATGGRTIPPPMQPISSPPAPSTTMRPWPAGVAPMPVAPTVDSEDGLVTPIDLLAAKPSKEPPR